MKNERISKAYYFFLNAENTGQSFTLEEIRKATGWKITTIDGYRTKKWYPFLVSENEAYHCVGFKATIPSEDVFINIHRQKADLREEPLRPRFSPTVDLLIDKARSSALLAVQIYNNPLAVFRCYGYIVQMVIAHTALFHAVFERKAIEYWYKNNDGTAKTIDGEKKYWECEECVRQYYSGKTLPEAENLRLIINMRNKIEHRFHPEIDLALSGYCQALLINFETLLLQNFDPYFSLGQSSLALALQLTEYSNDQWKVAKKFQANNYQAIKEYINDFCKGLPSETVQSEKFCFRAYLIPKLGNHASSSDVSIEFVKPDLSTPDGLEKYDKQIALIKEIRVQVADQGKYRVKDVCDAVQKRINFRLNVHLHTKAWKFFNVRTSDKDPSKCDTRYCQYSEPFRDVIYTDAWVNLLCKNFSDPIKFDEIKNFNPKNR